MKRMLFNATQAEELRVAIVDGQKLIDLDIESATKEQRKSNIYKAVITRIEPSLEAAFVDYGAERHGFLPFKEVAKSYFQPGIEPGRARIQDALKVGQELIVQVEKDERGNKGAALTTYISLAGRYLVLMPNNPRGGGVSRRIEGEERQELREVMEQLEVPAGMSLIARTAGIGRSVEELQWDLNYLLQLWRAIEGAAQAQSGPFLIYQESSLVIRAIRDYFQPEIGEILIDTDDIYEQARQFMAHVMPANVNRVKRYRDDVPLFSRFQIEHQIESAYARQVSLPSGGAVVIDHTEALVAIDVNSGRATKGADIEETALRTNLEAADEIARQLRLRDLGGLIVIDFIDMESQKSQREVENRLREALHYDRARVQIGKISRFGLLELSRQRLRPALAETSYITCPRCTGTGHIRSTESAALHILRILEEEAMKENTGAVHVQVPIDVATFLLNEKRIDIARIETRHRINLLIIPNRHLETPQHEIVRLRHDQLNQEGTPLPSYEMVSKPGEEVIPASQTESKASRPEAAVKGITPEQPAPLSPVSRKDKTDKQPGLLARILSWFSWGVKEKPPAEQAAKRTEKTDRRERSGRSRREREGREEGRSDRRLETAATAEPKDAGERKEAREGRGEPRDGHESRDQREGRPSRKERSERAAEGRREQKVAAGMAEEKTQAAASAVVAAGESAASEGPAPEGAGEGGRRRRRRGGRTRGERRREENILPAVTAAEQPLSAPEAEAPTEKPMPWPTPQPMAPTETVAALAADQPAAPGIESETVIAPIVAATPAAEPYPSGSEPAQGAAPAASTIGAAAGSSDLARELQKAGLELVETIIKPTSAPASEAPVQPLGRKPKPAPLIDDGPLQMIETRRSE